MSMDTESFLSSGITTCSSSIKFENMNQFKKIIKTKAKIDRSKSKTVIDCKEFTPINVEIPSIKKENNNI